MKPMESIRKFPSHTAIPEIDSSEDGKLNFSLNFYRTKAK